MAKNKTIGMWLYTNGGGDKISKKIIKKLKARDIDVVNNINVRNATAKNGHILYKDIKLDKRIQKYFGRNYYKIIHPLFLNQRIRP